MAQLRQEYARFQRENGEILYISTMTLEESKDAVRRFDSPFPLISDEKHEATDAYGVFNPDQTNRPVAHPATFIISPDGIIRYAYVALSSTDRPQPDSMIYKLYKIRRLLDAGRELP